MRKSGLGSLLAFPPTHKRSHVHPFFCFSSPFFSSLLFSSPLSSPLLFSFSLLPLSSLFFLFSFSFLFSLLSFLSCLFLNLFCTTQVSCVVGGRRCEWQRAMVSVKRRKCHW